MKTQALSRRAAIAFSIIISLAFWVVIAGMFINVISDDPTPVAGQAGYGEIAPAAGASKPRR